MVSVDDLTQKIDALRHDVVAANQLRHTLEGKQAAASEQLRQIDEEIRALGFDPESSDDALAKLEAALQLKVAEAAQRVADEMSALRQVAESLSSVP